ncbi:MAG: hypothetical protein ABI330_22205 [Caldimonas sp.]
MIDVDAASVVATVPVGQRPWNLAITPTARSSTSLAVAPAPSR